jgi:hypothetical protein
MTVKDATSGSPQVVASGARMTISDGAIMLVVPMTEFVDQSPSYRVTSFRHRGDFGLNPPHDWSGDIVPTVDEGLVELAP